MTAEQISLGSIGVRGFALGDPAQTLCDTSGGRQFMMAAAPAVGASSLGVIAAFLFRKSRYRVAATVGGAAIGAAVIGFSMTDYCGQPDRGQT